MSHLRSPHLRRRTFLGGSLGAGLAATLLRRLEAAAASGPPTRFLMIHKPCGTIPERFFPKGGGTPTSFQMGPITAAFEPLKNDLVIFDNLTAPRDGGWQGDRHGAGLISMVCGSRAVDDGEPINNDDQFHHITAPTPSVDQLLLTQSARLKSMGVGSANLGSYRDSVRGGRIYPEGGAANFRPVSYQASANGGLPTPIFPEVRPDVAVRNIFGSALPGGGADIAKQQQRNKSILDLIAKDLGTLRKQVPSSERVKLDSHLDAIQKMEMLVSTAGAPTSCMAPMVQPLMTTIPPGSPPGARIDALDHDLLSKTQLHTIKTAFQCDLMRVATFSYGHGNQDVQFQYVLNNFGTTSGFHDISHQQDANAVNQLSAVDTWYCARVAEFLTDLKNTPESDGSSMLDNTLVVFFSDVSVGWNHDSKRMPVVFFGGKSVGLKRGLGLDMKGQYMNDLWASVLQAFGVPLPADNKFAGYNVWKGVTGPRLGAGAISGIFG